MIARSCVFLEKAVKGALNLVYPPTCLVCARLLTNADRRFCPPCSREVKVAISTPSCPHCAHSIGPYGVQRGKCAFCRDSFQQIDGVVRAFQYKGAAAQLIRAIKYRSHQHIDAFLGELLAEAITLSAWFDAIDALVVVPTHWQRTWGRPYYVPNLLARQLSRRTGIRVAPILRRIAAGPHQMDVPRSQRVNNIRGKFSTFSGVDLEGAAVCLVDDVSTTGATLNECAHVLRKVGADSVFAAVAARVDSGEILAGV